MDHTSLFAYFVAVVALTAAPGPIVAVLVARSLGRDTGGATAFAAGLCLGDLLAVVAIAMGIGTLADSGPQWFALAKYAGVAYLLWLSFGMWSARSDQAGAQPGRRGWLASGGAGLALCLGNPSTILIYLLLLPTVAPEGIQSGQQLSIVALVTVVAVGTVFFGAILLARQVKRVIASPASTVIVNRATAAVTALTSVWILVA